MLLSSWLYSLRSRLRPSASRRLRRRSHPLHGDTRLKVPVAAEALEDRTLLSALQLVEILPNDGIPLEDGDVRHEAPTELTIQFNADGVIDPATLEEGIEIVRAGFDDAFGDAGDVTITPGFVGVGDEPNIAILRFAENLPDDLYQITIFGSGSTPLLDVDGDAFNAGQDEVLTFELDLGAQVVAIVAQPVVDDGAGTLVQNTDQIVVYFNDDDLDPASATDPRFYQLINTQETLDHTDDVIELPSDVVYDNVENTATLTFDSGIPEGTYRLRIGVADQPNNDVVTVNANEPNWRLQYTAWTGTLNTGLPTDSNGKPLPLDLSGEPESSVTALIIDSEDEPAGVGGQNDSPGTAEFIAGFGTDAGDDNSADITGTVTTMQSPVAIGPFTEDDGSINLATDTTLTSGNSVTIEGTIGDGPHGSGGSGGSGGGDFDFYQIAGVAQGSTITIDIDTPVPFQPLDSVVAVYDSNGNVLDFNDDENRNISLDSFLNFTAPLAGDYFVSVQGFRANDDFFITDPFDSASGPGVGSEGDYTLTIGLNTQDIDFFSFNLAAGDIFGANVFGANRLTLLDPNGMELIGSSQDATGIHPSASPLPGGGNAALSYVIPAAGTYSIGVTGNGAYTLQLRDFRPDLEEQPIGSQQTIFLDFDGAQIDTSIFGLPGIATLSGLNSFLSNWGLSTGDLNTVIDAIVGVFEESISTDIRAQGNNGDFDATGTLGDFDIEILNSRDHADPFGTTNVSRVIIGGSIAEFGIPTIGIAESIDVGNFETEETAVVLLDLLSAAAPDPNSLNSIALEVGASIIDLIGVGVGNIAAHEAGHFFAAWHTDQFNGTPNIMDQGGNPANTFGLGPDEIFGSADDVDVDFGPADTFVPNEGFTGTEDIVNALSFGLSTGTSLVSDDNSSITTATSVGGLDGIELVINSEIEPQPIALPPLPGGLDEPGHREIPIEAHFGSVGQTPVVPGNITTVFYNFQDIIGTDPQGNTLFNAITEEQKQRARDIFELYSNALGLEAIETPSQGITVATGDLRAVDPTLPTGPGGVGGVSAGGLGGIVVMDAAENFTDEYGGSWFQVALHEIGHSLGLGHSYDIPSIQGGGLTGEPVFPGDHDLVHLMRLWRPDSTDIDLYSFDVAEAGQFTAEIFAERLPAVSLLNSALTLFNASGAVLARNDDYFSNDSYIELEVEPGSYFIGVTSTGNLDYDPNVSDTGSGGTTDGDYELRLNFRRNPAAGEFLVDTTGTAFDGDADGEPGGAFEFWFQSGETIFVDKSNSASTTQDGSLSDPFSEIDQALSAVNPTGTGSTDIVRILGNGGDDGDLSTPEDALPYLIGFDDGLVPLEDGGTFVVPRGVTVMIDEGAVFKLTGAVIDVGSSSDLVDRSAAALQVLGTPDNQVVFTSFANDAIGGDSDGLSAGPRPDDWGGIVFRGDSDLEQEGIFLNRVSQADFSFGGGQVFVDSVLDIYNPIHIVEARPTVSFNTITTSADAAISADPNSFDDTIRGNRDTTLRRIGPDIHGNTVVDNNVNGLFVRVRTEFGKPIDVVEVTARFDDRDIVHVVTENIQIVGNPGGPEIVGGVLRSRESGRLRIDPGIVVKASGSRIEADRGHSNFIAEGTRENRVIMTSIFDDRFGRGGTFDTTNDEDATTPLPGDWGGIILNAVSTGSIDRALITFAGGLVPIEGNFDSFNAIEVHQAEFRLTNSRLENNAAGRSQSRRNGRGTNDATTVFVRGEQPVIARNLFLDNAGSAASINANALTADVHRDPGRSTGSVQIISDPLTGKNLFPDNHGPLVRLNVLDNNAINGMDIRPEELTTESIWDDADIVHVLRGEIIVPNFHTFGGLRLESSREASLVVKLSGANAGITASGRGLDIDDRIGGVVQIVGRPLRPVVLTSLADDDVGAGFRFDGQPQRDTNNDGSATSAQPGDWRSILLDEFSHDRNVEIVNESEGAVLRGSDFNAIPPDAQFLGELAPNDESGDENRRLGFEVHGFIAANNPDDADVYSFDADAGTQVWFDIDRTDPTLNAVVELLDPLGNVLAQSINNNTLSGLAAPLDADPGDPRLGSDYYTSNPNDPGMRVVLPGVTGRTTTYFVRIRSFGGLTTGDYQLRIRVDQTDEKPGSTIRHSDIRFAETGIEIFGLPAHSPLVGEAGEAPVANNALGQAQQLGNLLTSDRNTISVSGALSAPNDIDFYQFTIDYDLIQAIGGVNDGGKTWSTIFDIDYADGISRPNTIVSVFDEQGNLILVSRDSDIADDQPRPTEGNDFGDEERGTAGKLDPFIGSQQMPAGVVPLGVSRTYFVAISSNAQLPTALNATFQANTADPLVRLEPVNSVERIAEDHIGFSGHTTGRVGFGATRFISPRTDLFDISNSVALSANVRSFTLSDVVLFVTTSGGSLLQTFNAFTGATVSTPSINATSLAGNNGLGSLAFRQDGELFGQTAFGNNAASGNFLQIDTGTGTGTSVGDDGLGTNPNVGGDWDALTFYRRNNTVFEGIAANNTDADDNNDPADGLGLPRALYRLDPSGTARDENANAAGVQSLGPLPSPNTDVTGLAFGAYVSNDLYAVDDDGNLWQTFFSPGQATQFAGISSWSLVRSNVTGSGAGFTDLTLGPQNLDNGSQSSTLFATAEDGRLYAFDLGGNLQPVFAGGATSVSIGTGTTGLAFSPFDFNLWHPTMTRSGDPGHGINVSFDNSRNGNSDALVSIQGRRSNENEGGASLYFGLEQWTNTPVQDNVYLTYQSGTGQLGVLNSLIQRDLTSNPNIGNNYNAPGGIHGTLETNTFSLLGYDRDDLPALYVNYFLETEGAIGSFTDTTMFDSARIWISANDGASWSLLTTNNSLRSTGFQTAELPRFTSTAFDQSTHSQQRVQELFDNTNGWRQARVDLGEFAGQPNLKLRFDFATAGEIDDPTLPFENFAFGSINHRRQGQANNFEGFYIDDIIVGFAERGEMATGQSSAPTFFAVPQDPSNGAAEQVLAGPYQLEVRRGTEYGVLTQENLENILIFQQFDPNERMTRGITMTAPAGSAVADGDLFSITDQVHTIVFEFESAGGVAPGHVPVPFSPGSPDWVIANQMAAAINSVNTVLPGLVPEFSVRASSVTTSNLVQLFDAVDVGAGAVSNLTVNVTADTVAESGGSTTVTVLREGDVSQALTVALIAIDPSTGGGSDEVSLPATVTFAADSNTATFTLNGVDDGIADGTQSVLIRAAAAGFASVTDLVDVTDDETPELTVTITGPTSFPEPTTESVPVTTEMIANGDFETGDFTGWTVVNSGSGAWQINDGTFDPDGPSNPLPPISGSFDALTNQTGPSVQILSELITVPDIVNSAVLSWSDRIRNHATDFSDPNQEWRVHILDGSGSLLQEVFSTNPGDPLQQIGPNNRSFDLTTLFQSLEGQQIRVSFQEEDDQGFFNVTLDDVSLIITEPGNGDGIDVLYVGPNTTDWDTGQFDITQIDIVTFATQNLAGFDVIYVDDAARDSSADLSILQSRSAEITAFVNAGGGLVTDNGGDFGVPDFSWVPNAGSISIADFDNDTVVITALGNGHPVTQGLTNAGLSNWGNSQHNVFTVTAGMDVLATDGGGTANILADEFGAGKLVYFGLNPTGHQGLGESIELIQQAVAWAGGGVLSVGTTATVTRNTPTNTDLVVNLASHDLSEATVPSTVVIPTGQTSVSFPINAVDDIFADGDQLVTVTAFASGFLSGSSQVTVLDDADAIPPGTPVWTAQGPGPTLNGQVENVTPNDEVVGAVHTVVAHPTNSDILYLGATNGGIWKTTNATSASPSWTPLTDDLPSLSIGAMEMDPNDPNRLLAGIGRFSSFGLSGGILNGLLLTNDGGNSWSQITDPLLVGESISGVALRGNTLIASANPFGGPGGLFRSIDGGATWNEISGAAGSGLPSGGIFDLVGDPTSASRFYASAAGVGIFRSDDSGATWTNVSAADATLNTVITGGGNNNTEMAVSPTTGRIYTAVLINGQAAYIGFSDDLGATWTAMDLPQTMEADGDTEGLNPRVKPGGQGAIHFSIVVDPADANTVYVGGDRQDFPFTNFIGANDFSGRLFRGDTTVAPTGAVPSPQWEHLTHSNAIAAIPGGGTASSSAPHADSREMVFDANGDLIEVDDGGIYRRTSPQDNTGDWFSIIGDLQVTEFHDIAYDSVSNIIIGGAQDTGTPEQISSGSLVWDSVSTADGGDVAVDDMTLASLGQSIRYSSFQNLGAFRRRIVTAANTVVSAAFPTLTVVGGGAALIPQFVTPLELNEITATRLVIGGANSVYESFDQGDTIAEIGPGIGVNRNAMAYGGRQGGLANPDVLYVGSGSEVFVRTAATGALSPTSFPGNFVRDIVMDPNDWRSAYVIDSDQVFRTTDAGTSWSEITGTLIDAGLQTIEYVAGAVDSIFVGGLSGVFRMLTNAVGAWSEYGLELPNAPVYDLDYDVADDILLVGTLGRGAWTTQVNTVGGTKLTVDITGTAISELGGSSTATVTRTGDTTNALTVMLSSSDFTEASVPSTVTIPAGADFATFTVNSVNDPLADGTQTAIITASALGFDSITDSVDVLDDETARLSVFVNPGSISESGGTATGTVFRNTPVDEDQIVFLNSSDESEAQVPASVVIPAGQSSATFTINAVNELAADGIRTAIISATAPGFFRGDDTLQVFADSINAEQFRRLGDDNLDREQGQLLIHKNIISHAANAAISVDASPREPGSNLAHPGAAINLPTINDELLAHSVVIENNVLHNFGQAGIVFSGDPNANNVYLAVVPFGKIVNNTIFGGETAGGIGVQVTQNASPTLLNNIVANTDTGIQVDASSSSTVVGTTVFKGNNANGVTGSNAILLAVGDPLFVDSANENFYLTEGSRAIDSSLNRLADRPAIVEVKTPLKIPTSDIFAPAFDVFGQSRIDDPLQVPPPGLGSNIFKDRGAIERADFVGPFARLIVPEDNGPADGNSNLSEVFIPTPTPEPVREFVIQLVDLGIGIDDRNVSSAQFELRRRGVLLVEGVDYLFSYNANTDTVSLISTQAAFPNDAYTIDIDNSSATGVQDLAGNSLRPNRPDGSTQFSIVFGPEVVIDDVAVVEGDSGTTEATFTLTLSGPSDGVVTVDVATADGTATLADNDYQQLTTTPPTTITFAPGTMSQTVTVLINGDTIAESDETFFVDLSNVSANARIQDNQGLGTIINDDVPTLSVNDVVIDPEGDSGTTDAIFQVSISQAPVADVTVDVFTSDSTATAPEDYIAVPVTTLTFTPTGPLTIDVPVTVNGDLIVEPDEVFFVNLANVTGDAAIADGQGTGTIIDDEPKLSIDDVVVDPEGDSGTTNATFTVSLSKAGTDVITVTVTTADSTATEADNDYVPITAVLAFAPGVLTQTISVEVVGDLNLENDETFFVNLSNPVNANIDDGQGVATIIDDDTPVITIDDVVVDPEGDSGTTDAVFTVSLSKSTNAPVSVDVTTADGTATTADNDYVPVTTTLTFAPGVVTQTVSVAVIGDLVDEDDETFFVNLSNPVNGDIGDGQGVGTIINDDDPEISIDDVVVDPEGDIGTTDAVFTVSLSNATNEVITVDVATADGTATTADNDYVPVTTTLTFNPGDPLMQTVSVAVNGDLSDEDDETFFVNLFNPTNSTISDDQGVGTIINDDDPEISIDDVVIDPEGDAGTTDAVFTVSLSNPTNEVITVDVATVDGTATTADNDYIAVITTLTFNPGGSLTQTVSVTVNGDLIDENDETFLVALSNATNSTIADGTGIGTIVNDDDPVISINDVVVDPEGDDNTTTNAVFTVTLSNPTNEVITVAVATADGTATAADNDYEAVTTTLTFNPGGPLSQNVTVTVNGDFVDEDDETFSVNLSNQTNATIGDGQGLGTIINDDDPTISISDAAVNPEGNTGTTDAVFTVSLSHPTNEPITVDVDTADGTATVADNDYIPVSTTLTFNPGGSLTQTVPVPVVGDVDLESDEQFFVNLSNAVNAAIDDGEGIGTIINDDLPTISISDAVVDPEGGPGRTNAVFTVSLSEAFDKVVTVEAVTADGTATIADNDYSPNRVVLTFNPGDPLTQTVSVVVNGDLVDENDETFFVNLQLPVNGVIADGQGTATIVNDDDPEISVADVLIDPEGNSGTTNALFTVSLSRATNETVTVDIATADGTATVADDDYRAASTSLTFNPGGSLTQTFTVRVVGDTKLENYETFFVNLSNPTNATIGDAQGIGTIVNDETPNISISDAQPVSEGNSGTTNAVFTVTFSHPTNKTVTVDVVTADDTATMADNDYLPVSRKVTYNPKGPLVFLVPVAVVGDLTPESNETFFANLVNAGNATIVDGQGVGTIINDDDPPAGDIPEISISDARVTFEGDTGTTNSVFTVSLSKSSSQVVTVDVATADGTATLLDNDYISLNATLTFNPGGPLTQTVSVAVRGDTAEEADETFFVNLSNAVNGIISDPQGLGTILNDDPALRADAGQGGGTSAILTTSELSLVVDQAIERWMQTGLTQSQLDVLGGVTFQIVDLGPGMIGVSTGSVVILDVDAAGWGWFIDTTPADDGEFTTYAGGTEFTAAAGNPALGRMDLLTAVMHELGHALGLADSNDPQMLMSGRLPTGTRRLPTPAAAVSVNGLNLSIPDYQMGRNQVLTLALPPENEAGDVLSYSAELLGGDPVAERAYDLDQTYDFQLIPGSEENNYWHNARGAGGKYLSGFFILPDGELYQWGGSIAASRLIGALDSRYHDDPSLLVDAVPPAIPDVNVSIVDSKLVITPGVDFSGQFAVSVSVTDGNAGNSVSFTVSVTNSAPVLSPVGNQTVPQGETLEVNLSATDADGDDLSYSVTLHGVDPVAGRAYDLDQTYDFQLIPGSEENNYWYNTRGVGEKYLAGFFILPNGEVYKWNGSIAASPLISTLDSRYHDDPSLLVDAEDPALALDPAYALDQEYDFQLIPGSEANNYWYNARGAGEKYLAGFFILPNGEVHKWGGSIAASPLVGTVDTRYYDDPSLLVDVPRPTGPDVEVTIVGSKLIITPAVTFTGSFELTITVSDGSESDSETITVKVDEASLAGLSLDDAFRNLNVMEL